MKTVAPQRISALAEECVSETAVLARLLHRASDAPELQLSEEMQQELVTALLATRNAIRGIASVVRLEVGRLGL